MKVDIEDYVSDWKVYVLGHKEDINHTMLKLQEEIRHFEHTVNMILDDFHLVLSKQDTLNKISSQLIENFDKPNRPAAIGQDM